jgi:hypothetical protein
MLAGSDSLCWFIIQKDFDSLTEGHFTFHLSNNSEKRKENNKRKKFLNFNTLNDS